MTLPISLCLYSVVSKHLLLALSVLCLFVEFNNGQIDFLMQILEMF